ncbi:hypothetical protein B0H14DRAFT_2637281 [Mycena olivaceomarginata]|nr:hypothetical protein B0H14DRAFT_2637281 [Mycena olivaceomarginata]
MRSSTRTPPPSKFSHQRNRSSANFSGMHWMKVRLDTATALECTSITTDIPLDLYQILEGLLASDHRYLKVGSKQERNTPEVDLHLFAPKGTYVLHLAARKLRKEGWEDDGNVRLMGHTAGLQGRIG